MRHLKGSTVLEEGIYHGALHPKFLFYGIVRYHILKGQYRCEVF